MELTLEYKSAVSTVLHKFRLNFPDFSVLDKSAESLIEKLISRSIRELKKMSDFLAKSFTTSLAAPKRNSKISLSWWVAQVLLDATRIESSIEELSPPEEVVPAQSEVVEPEIYGICLLGDRLYSRHLVGKLPLYLIDGENLYQKSLFPSPSGIISYFQVLSQPLSDVEVDAIGTAKIELLCDNLLISAHNVRCIPPLYLVVEGKAAFKRMHRELITQNSVVRYYQLSSECLADILPSSPNSWKL